MAEHERILLPPGFRVKEKAPIQNFEQKFKAAGFTEPPAAPTRTQQMITGGAAALAEVPAIFAPGKGLTKLLTRTVLESIGPMAVETGLQKAKLRPESGQNIAAAGLTGPAVRGAFAAPGLIRGGGRGVAGFAIPQEARIVGEELAAKALKGPRPGPLFDIAREQGPLSGRLIVGSIDKAIKTEAGRANPNNPALRLLRNLKTKFSDQPTVKTAKGDFMVLKQEVPGGPVKNISYDDLIDEMQDLRIASVEAFAAKNHRTGQALNRARQEILKQMDAISPAIKNANLAYRQQESVKAIAKELRKQNPRTGLLNLFDKDKLVAETYSEEAKAALMDFAKRIGRLGTGITMGAGNRLLQAMAEPIAEAAQEPGGRIIMEILMKNPRNANHVARWVAILAAQFGRGAGLADEQQP